MASGAHSGEPDASKVSFVHRVPLAPRLSCFGDTGHVPVKNALDLDFDIHLIPV